MNNRTYRLWKGPNNWIIQRKRAVKGGERWENIAFYHTSKPHLAIGALLALMTEEGSYEGDALSIVDRVEGALQGSVERLTELLLSAESAAS